MNLTHRRPQEWWTDDPADSDRMLLNDPELQQWVTAISPESHTTDLGGAMSEVTPVCRTADRAKYRGLG